MCAQTGSYYNSNKIKSAISYFCSKANGYYDPAFKEDDIKQEAAIAAWLLKEKTAAAVYNHLVDCWRYLNFCKRSGKKVEYANFEIELDRPDYVLFDSRFCFDLNRLIQANKAEWPELEKFMLLAYVDEVKSSDIRKALNVSKWKLSRLSLKAREIATEASDYES